MVSSPSSSPRIDWQSVAAVTTERIEKPLFIVDDASRLQLLNRAAEQLIGWAHGEACGRTWMDVFGPADRRAAQLWLAQAFRGALSRHDVEVVSKRNERLSLALHITLVGGAHDRGLVVCVERATRIGDTHLAGRDLDYRVVAAPSDFGELEAIACVGESVTTTPTGGKCFAVLHGREAPCSDCPLLEHTTTWPHTVVRSDGDGAGYQVLTAEPADERSVRVSVRVVSSSSLAAIHEARMAMLAEKAHLTLRERDILKYLLLGRSLDDIAGTLELSRRTVKFHQANILQKLGADSRADLVRLVGF